MMMDFLCVWSDVATAQIALAGIDWETVPRGCDAINAAPIVAMMPAATTDGETVLAAEYLRPDLHWIALSCPADDAATVAAIKALPSVIGGKSRCCPQLSFARASVDPGVGSPVLIEEVLACVAISAMWAGSTMSGLALASDCEMLA